MKIKIFIPLLAVFLLFGCSRSSEMDINVFLEGFNKASEAVDFLPSESVFKINNNMFTHYCRIDENTLLTLDSLPDGKIHRCCVSFKHSGNFEVFADALSASISSFCNENDDAVKKIISDMKISKQNLTEGFSSRHETDWYIFNCESTKDATVFIIRAEKYTPETNTSPTLKEH